MIELEPEVHCHVSNLTPIRGWVAMVLPKYSNITQICVLLALQNMKQFTDLGETLCGKAYQRVETMAGKEQNSFAILSCMQAIKQHSYQLALVSTHDYGIK